MIRFFHPDALYLLALVPVLAAAFWFAGKLRRNALRRFGDPATLDRLADDASSAKRRLKFALVVAAAALLVIALANPQIGTRLEEVKQQGVDIFIALDVSLSMKAEDIKPNRLEKAKLEIRNLIDRLKGDRIGLIVFAGEAYTQFPLTTDYSAANLFLDAVDVDVVPVPGTSLSAAIERAMESIDLKENTTKVLIIITDGESFEGETAEAAEDAAKKGVLLYAIGMGSPEGAPIPVYNAQGHQVDFKRDKSGNVILTKLDEVTLEKIAAIGNGKYCRGTNAQDELDEIYKSVDALQKKEFGTKQFTDYEDRFQWFLAPALLLIIAEVLTSERKLRWLARWNVLGGRKEGKAQ